VGERVGKLGVFFGSKEGDFWSIVVSALLGKHDPEVILTLLRIRAIL
jgi:hypothetical protein